MRPQHEEYAIALPMGSALRERIIQSLTRIILESDWDDTVRGYLGY